MPRAPAERGRRKMGEVIFCITKYTKILLALLRQKWARKDKSCAQNNCTFQMSSVVFLGPQNATKSLVAPSLKVAVGLSYLLLQATTQDMDGCTHLSHIQATATTMIGSGCP